MVNKLLQSFALLEQCDCTATRKLWGIPKTSGLRTVQMVRSLVKKSIYAYLLVPCYSRFYYVLALRVAEKQYSEIGAAYSE